MKRQLEWSHKTAKLTTKNEIEKFIEFYFRLNLSSISNGSPVDDIQKCPTECLNAAAESARI